MRCMIRGLDPYAVKGTTWFQADGNLGHPTEYGELMVENGAGLPLRPFRTDKPGPR